MRVTDLEYALNKVGEHRNTILSNIISNASFEKDISGEVAQLEKMNELCLILADKIKKNVNEESITEVLYYSLGVVSNYRSSVFSNILSLEEQIQIVSFNSVEKYKQIIDNEKNQLEKMNELCLILADKIKKNLLLELPSPAMSNTTINATATSDSV